MKSAFLLFFWCGSLAAQQGSFSGIVLDAVTQQPLNGVHLTLTAVRTFGNPIETYAAVTEKDGRFSMPNIEPATYTIATKRNGFVDLTYDRKGLTLKPGDVVADRIVKMTPAAIITGKVLDAYGDPAENAFVHAFPVGGNFPISIVVDRMYARTDDRGQFRIVGAPGKYYVSATKGDAAMTRREIRTDGTEPLVYGETWYPDADSKAHSQVVEAIAGREVSGIDFRLSSKRSLRISGIVTGIPSTSTRVEVSANTKFRGFPLNTVDPDGRFTFAGLSPDHYRIRAKTTADGVELLSREAEVSLENGDHDSVTLELVAPQELPGKIEFEDGHPENHQVSLEANQKGGQVDRVGNFTLAGVYPGKYRIRVEPMAENAFIKAVQLNGAAVVGDSIDLSTGVKGSALKITVGSNGAQLSGSVTSDDGTKICCGMVVLAASPEEINDHMTAIPGGGKYSFKGIRPGKYRLIVAGRAQPYGTQSAEAAFPTAPEIEIHEGDRITRDVTFSSGKNSDAKP